MFVFARDLYRLLAGRDYAADIAKDDFDRCTGRRAASRLSRGNVAVQMGAFVTTDDLEAERRKVAKISFRT
ncbi:hypothetical protein EZH22_11010 [Xanthobacter dioxanivorans]|uniref:Uncharacterized protein n=1 Tax=Xanthobacter dioxanivorans TaxID=2528964 RepID=A0A974PS46_9HYPH|nr:hypothetical protein [Xanthobacter dioxanivorans]QRG08758.1 hypothetical protein EZH22_11010 [Xanthobacter dioxanivorans]